MIEKTVLDYLSENLDVPVYMEVPETPPNRFVVVEKTGSSRENHITQSTIAVQAYGSTLYEAAGLNENVKDAMDTLPVLGDVGASRLNSDYNFTDTSMKRYRYQAVYDVTHH